MPHIKLNWVDILFITLLVRVCYVGFKNGLLPEFFRFAGLFIAFILSFNSYIFVSAFLEKQARLSGVKSEVAAFLFIFLAILFIFKLLAVLVSKLLGSPKDISLANNAAGLVFALCRGVLLIGLIYVLFLHCPVKYLSRSAGERSFSGHYASQIAPFAYKVGISFYPWQKIETPLVKLITK